MTVLITGVAGFIGSHLAKRLINRGDCVIGIDNLNDYYDVSLKLDRLKPLMQEPDFRFIKLDLADRVGMEQLFAENSIDRVVNLAAQAGVRYSLKNPLAYIDSNLLGFAHLLENCRHYAIQHLVFASSSSVYGANRALPFSVHHNVDHPLSLYAASKKANELMAHSYAHLYQLPVTGLRFFTVYGPWGRPDMALFTFTRQILAGQPIEIFNQGHHRRDFTYIDDIVNGVVRVLDHIPQGNNQWSGVNPDPSCSLAPYKIYNIGNQQPIELMYYIEILEQCLGKTAIKTFLPLQAGDVIDTYADVSELVNDLHYQPATPVETGVSRFVEWYTTYYR